MRQQVLHSCRSCETQISLDYPAALEMQGKLNRGLGLEEVAGGVEGLWRQADWVEVTQVGQSVGEVMWEEMFEGAVVRGLSGMVD